MEICQGLSISTYYSCRENLHSAASAVYDKIISKAVKEENELILASNPNDNPIHLTVSVYDTWEKKEDSTHFLELLLL